MGDGRISYLIGHINIQTRFLVQTLGLNQILIKECDLTKKTYGTDFIELNINVLSWVACKFRKMKKKCWLHQLYLFIKMQISTV